MDRSPIKKRKMSFANDRLKKLRTSINNDVSSLSPNTSNKVFTPTLVKSSLTNNSKEFQEGKKQIINYNDHSSSLSPNKSNTVFTPSSVKNSLPNNTKGFQERKKLIPTRKLKNQSSGSNSININKQNHQLSVKNDIDESELFGSTPKRRKIDATVSNSSTSIKLCDNPIPQKNNFDVKSKKNVEQLPKISTITVLDQTPKRLIENVKNINKNSANSRIAKIKSNLGTNFSAISSNKTKFEYQHTSDVTTQPENIKNTCSSVDSKKGNASIGEALNTLFNKLFRCQNDSDNNKVECAENNDSMEWEPDEEFDPNILENEVERKSKRTIYIIVDTNIFLDSLNFLREIVNDGSKGGIEPVIYVPWMVFNELDDIKDNKLSGLKFAARRAIEFINKMLTTDKEKLIGQSIFEATQQMYVGKSPDNKIASCCHQVKAKGYNAILLTNDKNLRNRLNADNFPSYSCDGILTNLDDISPLQTKSAKNDKIETLMCVMKKCCENIIIDCCAEEYGNVWNKLALLDTQPWDFHMCLKIFQKYWSAVFRDKLLKQFLNVVEKMIPVMQKSAI
ncbi:transcriptional protein SWT1 isoform X2 [Harmonia axyridis]|uniref:transcriptional protein SWT1 isoform X2 n=1 Tax=Harmonia axyridis TaxID=115357 RepID=UPI001E277760|nr:transcriptional protein SWT1 isoform X2 [Harmonia axyridis]